jgi:hypothetical protein
MRILLSVCMCVCMCVCRRVLRHQAGRQGALGHGLPFQCCQTPAVCGQRHDRCDSYHTHTHMQTHRERERHADRDVHTQLLQQRISHHSGMGPRTNVVCVRVCVCSVGCVCAPVESDAQCAAAAQCGHPLPLLDSALLHYRDRGGLPLETSRNSHSAFAVSDPQAGMTHMQCRVMTVRRPRGPHHTPCPA